MRPRSAPASASASALGERDRGARGKRKCYGKGKHLVHQAWLLGKGALSVASGILDVSCNANDDEVVVMWTERGGPLILTPVKLQGFGSKLVHRSMAAAWRHHRVRLVRGGGGRHPANEQRTPRKLMTSKDRIAVAFCMWHIASFRSDAATKSLSERSGQSASHAFRTDFMSTRRRQRRRQPSLVARKIKSKLLSRRA